MAITLSLTAGGSLLPEWAATNSNSNRQVMNVNGEMVPVFTSNLGYSLITYLVQDGKKVGIVQTGNAAPGMPNPGAQDTQGNLYLSAEELVRDMTADPKLLESFNYIADYEDGKIRKDLIARKLIGA